MFMDGTLQAELTKANHQFESEQMARAMREGVVPQIEISSPLAVADLP